MKKKGIVVLIIIVVLVSTSYCWADEITITKEQITEARINIAKKTVGFTAGFLAGLAFHELGHEVVGRLEGAEMHWSGTEWNTNASPSDMRRIAIAGFGAQILSTEIILGVEDIPKDNAFVLGWLGYNILNGIYYVVQDQIHSDGYDDIKTLRNNGFDTTYLKIGLVLYSLVSAYRLYKNPKFAPYVGVTKNEIVLGFTKTF